VLEVDVGCKGPKVADRAECGMCGCVACRCGLYSAKVTDEKECLNQTVGTHKREWLRGHVLVAYRLLPSVADPCSFIVKDTFTVEVVV